MENSRFASSLTAEEVEQQAGFAQQLIEMRRQLHRQPELSNEEFATTEAIRGWLREHGIAIADAAFPLPTGLVAEVGGLQDGPTIALRADIDALPVQEESGLPFASEVPGRMHACGHDFHTAAMIGAAVLLKRKERELRGKVRFLFQPAEEKATGAQVVIQSGALSGVSAIFGMHNKPDLPVGTVGIKGGPLMAAADGFVVEVAGVGSHAAVPEAGNDPIVTASAIVMALQTIVSRGVSALDSAVISVTKLNSGTAWNVIPESAVLEGTVRTFDGAVREKVRQRFREVIDGVAAAYGTTAKIRWLQGPPPVHNDDALAELAARTAERRELTAVVPRPSPAGEDFAFYQQQVPGLFVFMGTSGTNEWHHPAFTINEDALAVSARYFAALAEDALLHLTEKSTEE